jgi:ribosomal protein L16 Arg81 hydroxylase
MTFDELIAPITRDKFFSEIYDRRPLHIAAPAGGAKAATLGWEDLNRLLAIRAHWTPANLKLLINSRAMASEFYTASVDTREGPQLRADPAKVDVFLGMGASLVADALEEVSPPVRAICDMLADTFGGRSGANAYASFQGVQAFASHCDLHDVFALQCDGEKTWRLYQNRALDPVDPPSPVGDAQQRIDAEKGPVAGEVRMRPGDILYLPRGWYHDALASSTRSLHISFAVMPLYGRALFRLLEAEAMEDPEFRAYLPDGRGDGGAALGARLDLLAGRLADILRRPSFTAALVNRQRELTTPAYPLHLPERLQLEHFMRLDVPAELARGHAAASVRTPGGEFPVELGIAEAVEWLLQRPAISVQELGARYRHLPQAPLRAAVERLAQAGVLRAYTPKL